MSRHARINVPGFITHVMSRGIDGRHIFETNEERMAFIERLGANLAPTGFHCAAWCIMPNHYHLLLRSEGALLSKIMRPLNTGYAAWYNKLHGRRGYVFQDRFKSLVCQKQGYALELIRYVHLNPLRAGLVKDLNALSHYKWAGHGAVIGTQKPYPWHNIKDILRKFGKKIQSARNVYQAFLREGIADYSADIPNNSYSENLPDISIDSGTVHSGVVGDPQFIKKAMETADAEKALIAARRAAGWNVEKIKRFVCHKTSISIDDILRRGRANKRAEARYAIVYLACTELGLAGLAVGRTLGMNSFAASRALRLGKGATKRLGLKLPVYPE